MNSKLRRLSKQRSFRHYKRELSPITIAIRLNTRILEMARQNAEMFREAFKQVQDVMGADIEPLKAKVLEMNNKPYTHGPPATDSWRDESVRWRKDA